MTSVRTIHVEQTFIEYTDMSIRVYIGLPRLTEYHIDLKCIEKLSWVVV